MFSKAISAIKKDKPSDKPAPRRMANTEKYVGGRGATEGVLRTEKRGNGRLRTNKVSSNLGDVQDVSATGCRVCMKKKPTFDVGASISIELSSDDVSLSIPCTVMWVRVMKDCTFHAGLQFVGSDPARTPQLLDIIRSGIANDGLTLGWSPLAGYLEAHKLGE
jgi:PilZ domain